LSDFVQDHFYANHGVRPAHVVPPGIDRNLFSHAHQDRYIDLLAAGSLIPLKQYEIFIEVVARLKQNHPNIKAMLVGNGPAAPALKAMVSDRQLDENLDIRNEIPHAELLLLMENTKIFIHPSSFEGFGVVCIEALYAGAQVISLCKPMKQPVTNWHIADSKEKIMKLADELLSQNNFGNQICPFPIEESAIKMMGLLGIQQRQMAGQ
jgi:glycosyltransferase involved in cell wall biosynthesis